MELSEGRINFPNGWVIDVHEIRGGQVYYQRWPPGIEHQSFFDNLFRKDVEQFSSLVEAEGGKAEMP